MKKTHSYVCNHCQHGFDSERKLPLGKRYCPYCATVLFGVQDASWLPSLPEKAIKGRGFHKV